MQHLRHQLNYFADQTGNQPKRKAMFIEYGSAV
jgi:hypothetical protein